MLINSCAGRWSLLLTGHISAHSNVHRGTAETGDYKRSFGLLSSLGSFFNVNDYKLSALNVFERKVPMQCIYEGNPVMALGEWQTKCSARGSPQTLGCFRQSIGSLVLALFNAHGAINAPGSLKPWLTMLGLFVPASWA